MCNKKWNTWREKDLFHPALYFGRLTLQTTSTSSTSAFHVLPAGRDCREESEAEYLFPRLLPFKTIASIWEPSHSYRYPWLCWVLVSTLSPWPSDLEVVTASCCCLPWDVSPSLKVLFNPAYTFANSLFIKLSSVTLAWVYCIFPLCVCWGSWGGVGGWCPHWSEKQLYK